MSFSELNNARYSSHSYLSACDLINKNIFKSFFNRPSVEKLFLELPTSVFETVEDSLKESNSSSDVQVESFLVLYLIRLHKPLVFLDSSTSLKKNSNACFVKIAFSEQEDIYLFLLNLFVENLSELVIEIKDLSNSFGKTWIQDDILALKNFAVNGSLPVEAFLGLENSFSKSSFDSKLRRLDLKIRFLFEVFGCKSFSPSRNYIRNIPLFWISC